MEEKIYVEKDKVEHSYRGSFAWCRNCSTNHVQADAVSDAQSNTQVVQNSNQSQSSTTEKKAPAFNKSDYLSSNPKIIRLKHNATIYKDAALTQVDHHAKKGYHYLTSKLVTPTDSAPVLKLSNGKYISAKKSLIAKVKGYQNPKGYLTHKSSLTVMPATTFTADMKVLKLRK